MSIEQARHRLMGFRDSIMSQALGNGIVTPLDMDLDLRETRPAVYLFYASNWSGRIDRATGRVSSFRAAGDWDIRWQPGIAITAERCRELSLKYFHAAGFEDDDLLFREIVPAAEEFNNKSQEAVWSIYAQRVHNGITVDWRHPVMLELEPTTGQLASLVVDDRGSVLSEPRTPTTGIEVARQTMVAEVFRRFHASTLEESTPMYLCAFDPAATSRDESDFSSPIAVQALRQGKVLLAWDCMAHLTDGQQNEKWIRVVVHAHSGQLLFIEKEGGSFGSGHDAKATAPVRWDWGVGPIEVLAHASAWSTPSGDIENVEGPPKAQSASWTPVILRRARLLVRAEFDPVSGKVRTNAGVRPVYGMPNKHLLGILRSAVGDSRFPIPDSRFPATDNSRMKRETRA
ncbi:MAG: hypothetical protein M9921_01960 [Fimbriimonadaceae bacterium]|nr:hypothetical protein [Chthonomonadaceae bacterium]MCO5295601.1 hypothetical protein [Fimbriimonadaceae bacterium]